MLSKILRGVLIVLLSTLVARHVWLGVVVQETDRTLDNIQVKPAANDVKRIREVLDFISGAYSLGKQEGQTYKTDDYAAFRKRVRRIADSLGGMPIELPHRPNFTRFAYTENLKGYHIKIKAKGSNKTIVHATRDRLWYE